MRGLVRAAQRWVVAIGIVVVVVVTCFWLAVRVTHQQRNSILTADDTNAWSQSETLLNDLSLTSDACQAAFPNLTWPIQDAMDQGPFSLPKTESMGPLIVKILDRRLTILSAARWSDLSQDMIRDRASSLHQIHRAMLTAPPMEAVPDTIIALITQDQPYGFSWAYSRHATRTDANIRTFLMPHYSFWAWRQPSIRSFWHASTAIQAVEAAHPRFSNKDSRAVWRGTVWYSSIHNPGLRQNLLTVAKGKVWADVEALDLRESAVNHLLRIEDFCRYRYILYTEGVTYSGRLQYHQMCASVVITPPIGWMQHTTHLMRPLFTSTLDLPGMPHPSWTPSRAIESAWPTKYAPEEADVVFVAPDWHDLEATIAWLEAHPDVAAGIAQRQRDRFVGHGYLSRAAETCYWRALIRGWARVVRLDEDLWNGGEEAESYESFTLSNGT